MRSLSSRLAAIAAVLYAAMAGFRTLADFDVWWQLASGRWMWEHGAVMRQEVFSYTAPGAPWIYPAGSGTLFYWIWRMAGPSALSLLAPATCGIVALILIRQGGVLRAWTLALAVPVVAWRCAVRADLFTTLLTAAFLALLWQAHTAEESRRHRWLWLLPLLMIAWVNLHPGFLLGVAAMLAFGVRHPRRMLPWTLATLAATLANPFGWRVYIWARTLLGLLPLPAALHSASYNNAFIGEFAHTPLSPAVLGDALRWRDPDSSFWWLMALAAVAATAGLFRGQGWGSLALAAAAAGAIACSRFQAAFAITAVVIAPDLLSDPELRKRRVVGGGSIAATMLMLLIGVRIFDLATNRYYISHADLARFGAGVSSWFPERAVRFLIDHHLPREVYHDYNLGGYATWAMAPRYPVFIDGRGDPYGQDLFFLHLRLGQEGPDAPGWQSTLDRWKIRTLLVSVSRYGGFGALPLKAFCDSGRFRLAYLDETAAVFVRNEPGLSLPALNCQTALLIPPANTAPEWDRYQFYANAGKLYYALERDSEADQALAQARAIFDGDASLHLDIGQLRHAQNRIPEAESEFRQAVKLRGTPTAWYALADLLAQQGRPQEAMEYFRESAERDPRPHQAWAAMAQSALAAQRPSIALDGANRALDANPYQGPALNLGRGFVARTLALRAAAYLILQQAPQAIDSLEMATRIANEPRLSAGIRVELAEAYWRVGRLGDARRTLEDAIRLGAQGEIVEHLKKELEPVPNGR